jgi:hypothetical protein
VGGKEANRGFFLLMFCAHAAYTLRYLQRWTLRREGGGSQKEKKMGMRTTQKSKTE